MKKKLLILGATHTELMIIERARANGIYTIATDYNTDYSLSPAKKYADEAWDISWGDIDALYDKCKECGVDGVIAGFSEFRVENMIKLCERLNFPCYLNMEQLDVTRDKIKFKNLCKEYNIPGVPEYQYGKEIEFPVIIKPVDRAGSIGINVAYNSEEFEEYYQNALSLSPSKSVIIEDFIDDGIKFDVYYYVMDGKVTLLGTSDTVMCEGTEAAPILQKAWVFPSVYEKLYLEKIDDNIRKMLHGIGLNNGYVTISAFCRNNEFYVFEAGFRLSGEMSFNYYKKVKNIDYLDLLIDFSLGNKTSNVQLSDAVNVQGCSVILNFFGKSGKIEKIEIPEINNRKEIIATNLCVEKGDSIDNTTSVLKLVAMYTLYSEDRAKLIDAIDYVNSNLNIIDTSGKNLIYERVEPRDLGLKIESVFNGFTIMRKPYYITWKHIQNLLDEAHKTNEEKGLRYATRNQSIEKLKEKVQNSICFVALDGITLAGTGTVQFRNLNYWYHSGKIGLLKLLAISPKYRGNNLASMLIEARLLSTKDHNIEVCVSDSAEANIAIKKLYTRHGFKMVDCCVYPENNFYSTVYAKWLNSRPWNNLYITVKYFLRKIIVHLKYKPGKIKRFNF